MALRIPWNDHESAFLLHMLIEVLQKKIDRKTAISITSRKLRQFAITNGIDIDEKFRNENGIRLQMGCLEYAFTGGASGLPVKTGWYYKTVGLYRDHPEQFDSLVKEVVEMDGAPGMKMQDRFFRWLSSRVSPAQLSELYLVYNVIDDAFTRMKILKAPLFQTTDLTALSQVRDTIECKWYFRRDRGKLSSAIRYYISYIQENQTTLPEQQPHAEEERRPDRVSTSLTETKGSRPEPNAGAAEKTAADNSPAAPAEDQTPLSFRPRPSSGGAPAEQEPGQTVLDFGNFAEEDIHKPFERWMIANGLAQSTANDYIYAIKYVNVFATKKGYLKKNIFFTTALDLKGLQARLSMDSEFIAHNQDNNHLYEAALKKYMEFCKAEPSQEDTCEQFERWMLKNSMSRSAADNYISALTRINILAREKRYINKNLFSITAVPELANLQNRLNRDRKFAAFKQKRRYEAALRMYMEFCRAKEVLPEPKLEQPQQKRKETAKGDACGQFHKWMLGNGITPSKCDNCISALTLISIFAMRKGYLDKNIFSVTAVADLIDLQIRLNGDGEFAALQHKDSCEAALKVYIAFCKATERPHEPESGLTPTQPEGTGRVDICGQFYGWMLENGAAQSTAANYVTAIKYVDVLAKRRGYLNKSLFSIKTVSELEDLQTELRGDREFIMRNRDNKYLYEAALGKYIAFFKAKEDTAGMGTGTKLVPPNTPLPPKTPIRRGPVPPDTSVPPEIARNYTALLREAFPDGFIMDNVIHVKKFIRLYEERFGAIKVSREELVDQLKKVGVVRDERIYPQNGGQKSLMDEIYEAVCDVFRNGGTCVYLSMILQRYGQRLGEQNIYNENSLQQALYESYPSLMFRGGSRGYIYEYDARADASDDVLNFMRQSHTPLDYEGIQSALWYLPLDKIKTALVQTATLVNVDQETYFYAPNLPINADELQTLARVMDTEISAVGFLTAKDLKRLIDEHCPSAAIDTADMKDWGIRNCLGCILRDRFEFTGALISGKGSPVTIADVYIKFCSHHDRLTLEQLKEFSAEIGQPVRWDDVLSVMVRTSEDEMKRADGIHFDIEETDAALDSVCAGDYIPIREIGLYFQFPPIEVPWNGYVLESYLKMNDSMRFQRLPERGAAEDRYYGVVVRRESKLQTYDDVIVDILAHSTAWKNESEALSLLAERGVLARRQYSKITEAARKARRLRERPEIR